MYTRVSELKNLTIAARDGDIGRCRDFLFDDESWTVRYLELNTSRWLLGRRVLISPAVVGEADFDAERLPVDLTRKHIESAPGLGEEQPVSRAYEEEFARHYGHMYYWWGAGLWGAGPYPGNILLPKEGAPEPEPDEINSIERENHLRSAKEVHGYVIQAIDGQLGEVDDFIVDTSTWTIGFVVLDTRRWLPGKKVMLPVAWAAGISWADRSFRVDVTKEVLELAPALEEPLTGDDIVAFYAHFGRSLPEVGQ